ncbi:MAG: hypothetical protein DRO87_04320 [Candidatus Thorarchaeota archaeon]|nr:MAG: hypothetical protein DRP09_09250 [Candidatus Thorarchaeota archaeon]RLI58988.1 MAG: hypothetical protein DRO87_04320 [Candidatus Thorarchaeota archaeon]
MSRPIEVPLAPECSACIVSSLKTMIPLLTAEPNEQFEMFRLAYKRISEGYDKGLTPVVLSISLYQELYTRAGVEDPYKQIKYESTKAALKTLPLIEERLRGLEGKEALDASLAAAITGNVIDFNTAAHSPDLDRLVETFDEIRGEGFHIDDTEALWSSLTSRTGDLMYLADNAGEVLFDIPLVRLIRSLGWRVIYVVKGKPMINDATREDTTGTELETLADIIDTGGWAHGVPMEWVSREFLDAVRSADIVISKGQANIETFPAIQQQTGVETYYVTRAKCPHISAAIGTEAGTNVVMRRTGHVVPK